MPSPATERGAFENRYREYCDVCQSGQLKRLMEFSTPSASFLVGFGSGETVFRVCSTLAEQEALDDANPTLRRAWSSPSSTRRTLNASTISARPSRRVCGIQRKGNCTVAIMRRTCAEGGGRLVFSDARRRGREGFCLTVQVYSRQDDVGRRFAALLLEIVENVTGRLEERGGQTTHDRVSSAERGKSSDGRVDLVIVHLAILHISATAPWEFYPEWCVINVIRSDVSAKEIGFAQDCIHRRS